MLEEAEQKKKEREAKEAKKAAIEAANMPTVSSSSSSSSALAIPNAPGLVAAADKMFCSECMERAPACICTVSTHAFSNVANKHKVKSVAFPATLCGESAVEAILDETVLDKLPAMTAGVSSTPSQDVSFACDTLLFEFCCSENSMLCRVAGEYNIPFLRLHKGYFDCSKAEDISQLRELISKVQHPVIWISLPCTDWTQWQNVCQAMYGDEYRKRLANRRRRSRLMLRNALATAQQVLSQQGSVVFEWPRGASGWRLPELLQFIQDKNLVMVDFDGCAVGLVDKDGHPHLKRWRVVTNNNRFANTLGQHKCQHSNDFKHSPIEGSRTEKTAYYPRKMCELVINALFPKETATHVPAMPCRVVTPQTEHREKEDIGCSIFAESIRALEVQQNPGQKVPAMVTRLLDRKEMLANPRALQAVRNEANGLVSGGTWLLETVQELATLKQQARTKGEKIVIGQLMTICSENFAELADKSKRVLKGRVVFRGDNARDENGALAIYQDLAASPTLVTSANANIAYGLFRGNKTTSADAVKAYIQSVLKAIYPTFVELPRELWPDEWKGKYNRPVVRLEKSLYGHPESGAHWQNHLEDILKSKMNAEVMTGHQSTYFFPTSKLLLTVYVDDFLVSGPEDAHDSFWQELSKHVKLEDISGLGRFLGRYHEVLTEGSEKLFAFAMPDYVKSACELHEAMPGSKKLKPAPTPFVNEGSLVPDDDESRGELTDNASRVLMKCLWVARLARPDLLKPITALARHVQSWTVNCDKQLYRLMCYMSATTDLKLTGRVNDALSDVHLRLYVDADFAGDREDTRSTSGGFLVLAGPNTFFPLAWVSKKQTATSKSTAESELVSMSLSLFEEGIPMLTLWQKLAGKQFTLVIKEDNEATIKIVQKGYSSKLRSLARTHRVNLGAIHDIVTSDDVRLEHVATAEQAADVFTKALDPQKWGNAMQLLGMKHLPTNFG